MPYCITIDNLLPYGRCCSRRWERMFRGGVESVLITVEKGVDKFVYKYGVFNGERRG